MAVRLHCIIKGRVQGVCFRQYTVDEAETLGLTGWVRNRSDGTVELVAEGESDKLKRLEEWCRQGPSYAHVTSVQAEYSDATREFGGFQVAW